MTRLVIPGTLNRRWVGFKTCVWGTKCVVDEVRYGTYVVRETMVNEVVFEMSRPGRRPGVEGVRNDALERW